MIVVENLNKSFGSQTLFKGISFKLNPKERIGVVGRNGHGKTTLFRLLIGEELPDEGTINVPKHYRIACVRQEIEFTEDTVLAEGMTGLREENQDHFWKVEKILAGLGFSKKDMQRHPEEFSGGFQVRLNLAKVLASEPDLLLLDEPTNFLDITSIRWVERFLMHWPGELMMITHDRGFMDKIVTHTLGIHRKKIRKISGNTEKYYNQIAQDEEIYEKTRINDERRRKEIELFINRFRAKARLANLVQSRVKTLSKLERKEKLENLKTLDFYFRSIPFPGKFLMNVRDISFSYHQNQPLIRNFSVSVRAGDRICVVGKNGKGKTTLLKLLSGVLKPKKGNIDSHPSVTQGFFEQANVKDLVHTRTIEEEILSSHTDVNRQSARNLCGAMMFEGNDALKRIGVLSGGEKMRVLLGKIIATPVNFLLLDEPTNHLDMESCDALLSAIDNFDGSVIMVTHNEMFLHTLADRLIVFQNNQAYVFEGSYQRFLDKVGWKDGGHAPISEPKKIDTANPNLKLTRKEIRRKRSAFVIERAKVLKPLEQQILNTENAIEKHEKKLDELNTAMQEASQVQDPKRIASVSQSIHGCRTTIDSLFDELEKFTTSFEEQNAMFEKKWQQLESDMN
ncbi:MAG: ABC-F family ATP-binding cassette domain-containing protein [Desulfobacterales bacterium]|nr:MAG: ABC-F family ATP-binding cassette domain-containing protein [Desulfobacterales bacterium]